MNFSEVLEALKQGKAVRRAGWNGKGMHLQVQFPDEWSKMTHPYAYMTIPNCSEGLRRIPYHFATVDVFAEDWSVID